MNDQSTPRAPSDENTPDPSPSTDPGAGITSESESMPTSATCKEWEESQPHHPLQRVRRMSVAHMYKGDLFGPPSRILEPARKHVRLDWVRIFQEAKAARDAATAANEAEGWQ